MPAPSKQKNKIVDAFDAHCTFRYALEFQSRQNDSLMRLDNLTGRIQDAIELHTPGVPPWHTEQLLIRTLNECTNRLRSSQLPKWLTDTARIPDQTDPIIDRLADHFIGAAEALAPNLTIGETYSWPLIATRGVHTQDLLQIYARLQHEERDLDMLWKAKDAPPPDPNDLRHIVFLHNWREYIPLKKSDRPLGPALIDTERWPVTIGGEEVTNHLILALPYDRVNEDLEDLFDGFKRYFKRLALKHAKYGRHRQSKDEMAALLKSVSQIESPDVRHKRVSIKNGGAIVSHLCGLLCLDLMACAPSRIKAIPIDAVTTLKKYGFRYTCPASRKAFDAIDANIHAAAQACGWLGPR